MKKIHIIISMLLLTTAATAQMKIKDGTIAGTSTSPNANAILDLESNNKGLLMPRVALTSTTSFAPLMAHVVGMTVYNTISRNDVTPGYYYDNGIKWVRLADATTSLPIGPANGNFWSLLGNSGTNSTTNFMGTTDNQDVVFKRFNVQSGLLNNSLANTSWGVGSLNPATTGQRNVANGYKVLASNTTGGSNIGSGYLTLFTNSTGNGNVASGDQAMYFNSSGSNNVAIGLQAMNENTLGSQNTAVGEQALNDNTTGNSNAAYGQWALISNKTGSLNTACGQAALDNNLSGSRNTALGEGAGQTNRAGNLNTLLGYNADLSVDGLTNATAVGANAIVGQSNSIVLGGTGTTNAVNVGIGTIAPKNTLEIVSKTSGTSGLTLTNLTQVTTPVNNDVLSLDANNNVVLVQAPAGNSLPTGPANGNFWSLVGNSGTNSTTNFIGTTDDQDVVFKRNNVQSGLLNNTLANTSWGVGALNPLTTGNQNVADGYQALHLNANGAQNVADGYQALFNNSAGYGNLASGLQALFTNSSGNNNVANGSTAMYLNTTGSQNTAVGGQALFYNTTGNYNVGVGTRALFGNQTGSFNSGFGIGAFDNNFFGSYNSGVGEGVFNDNYSGNYNAGLGANAGMTNRTGSNITIIGSNADVSIDGLTNATAIGANAIVGQSNSIILGGTGTTNAVNVGIGTIAPKNTLEIVSQTPGTSGLTLTSLTQVTTPVNNNVLSLDANNNVVLVQAPAGSSLPTGSANGNFWSLVGNSGTNSTTNFIGTTDDQDVVFKRNNVQAGLLDRSFQNTAWGVGALTAFTNGGQNVADGYDALFSNTLGYDNVASGYNALYSNTVGNYNTAVGSGALYFNTTGLVNVAVGNSALLENTTGWGNVALGSGAMYQNTTGQANVSLGGLVNNTSGNYNVAVGAGALTTNTIGDANIAVGYGSDVSTNNLNNTTVIGNAAIVNASDKVRIGNNGVTVIEGQVAYSYPSDARFKYNVRSSTLGLDFIKQLKPVTYNFDTKKFDEHIMQNMPDSVKKERMKGTNYATSSSIVHIGFLAQDIEKICKANGYTFDGLHIPDPNNKTDNYSLAYSQFVMPLVNSVQELSSQNDSLKAELTDVQQQLNDLKNAVAELQRGTTKSEGTSTLVNLDEAKLEQNAPNPYTSTTVIAYYIPESVFDAQLIVTDINGQTVKAITLNSKGNGNIMLNAGSLASGTYFYSLITDGQKVDTKQMVLTK